MNNIDCREALEVISLLDSIEKQKIPIEIIENLKKRANGISSETVYRKDGNIVLSRNAKIILTYIYSNYIVDKVYEKEAIHKKMAENRRIKDVIISRKINNNLMIKMEKDDKKIENKNYLEEKSLIIKKETFWEKILNIVINFF